MKCKIVNNEVVEKYRLHSFKMGDVEDPEIYVAEPIYQWQQTQHGKFCMEKGIDLEYHMHFDYAYLGYQVAITGYMTPKNYTFLSLITD